jgi:hypothetical protein
MPDDDRWNSHRLRAEREMQPVVIAELDLGDDKVDVWGAPTGAGRTRRRARRQPGLARGKRIRPGHLIARRIHPRRQLLGKVCLMRDDEDMRSKAQKTRLP